MTGRIPSAHGIHDWIRAGNMPPATDRYLDGLSCYTDVLHEDGYINGLCGKWHLGDSLNPQHGFSHWFALPTGSSRYNNAEMIQNGEVEIYTGYITDIITDNAMNFIRQNAENPFYLSVNYNAPHSPFEGHPSELMDFYDNCPFKTCPQEVAHPWATANSQRHLGNRESLKGYFSAITAMDHNIGRLIDLIEHLSLRESTLFVFSSDNGYSCGHNGFWHKGNGTFPLNMYENSIKVPFIMSQPSKIAEGKSTTAMVSQYDFMPTLLDYIGLNINEDNLSPGRSFTSVLFEQHNEVQDEVVIFDEYGPVRMVRNQEWKYIHRYPYGPHELYHLANDPNERKNIVDEKSKSALVEEMRQLLANWFDRYVIPNLDGSRYPVTGGGQVKKIGPFRSGETSFLTRG